MNEADCAGVCSVCGWLVHGFCLFIVFLLMHGLHKCSNFYYNKYTLLIIINQILFIFIK